MLQLQHHQPACHQPSQVSESHTILLPDTTGNKASNSLLLSKLQSENSLELAFGNAQLLPPHLFGVSVSPVSSAAHLLDAHLHISSNVSPFASMFTQQNSFAVQSPSYKLVTLQNGDCEMEDLTSLPMGKFVLVKWEFSCSLDPQISLGWEVFSYKRCVDGGLILLYFATVNNSQKQ